LSPIYLSNGKIIVDGDKLGCCCQECSCDCGEALSLTNGQPITLHIKIKVPYSPGFAYANRCITEIRNENFDPELPIYYSEASCIDGKYTVKWLDGTFFHNLHLAYEDLGGCDCETGENCSYKICGWTELGFPDGVNPGDNYSILEITTSNGCL
jgi:hypothetical protein